MSGLDVNLGSSVGEPGLDLCKQTPFVRDLSRLEGGLKKAALVGYAAIFDRAFFAVVQGKRQGRGYAGRKDALEQLKTEVDDLRVALRAYLAVRIDPRIADQVFRPIAAGTAPRVRAAGLAVKDALLNPAFLTSTSERLGAGGTQFGSFYRGGLLGRAAADVDRLEAKLAPEIADRVLTDQRMMAEARAAYGLWFSLVRVSLATVVVHALPYDAIWRGVYGNAGYWLSLQLDKLAADIVASPAYADLVTAAPGQPWVGGYVSLGASGSGTPPFPLARTLDGLSREPAAWRDNWRKQPAPPADQGTKMPADFDPIPPAVHRNPMYASALPDHMFARQTAQQRVEQVARHWDWLRREVLGLPDEAVRFRINAGSLEHGGAHPPHKTHRNGAMFDLGLGRPGEFAVPTRKENTASGPVIGPQRAQATLGALPTITNIIDALRDLFGLLAEPDDPEVPNAGSAQGTIRANDFEFPPGGSTTEEGVEVPYADIAFRFTQAMLLTFPSQILYARWATLRDALSDLIDRTTAAESALTQARRRLTQEESTALAFLKKKLGNKPPADLPSSGRFGVLIQKDDHADHWHLSYAPGDVDSEDANRDTALQWIERNRDLLWPSMSTR